MPPAIILAICAVVLFAFLRYYHFAHLEYVIDELKADNRRLCDTTTALYLDLELADPNAESLAIAERVFKELRNQPQPGRDFSDYLVTLERRTIERGVTQ